MKMNKIFKKGSFNKNSRNSWFLVMPFLTFSAFLVIVPLFFIIYYAFKSDTASNWSLIVNPFSKNTVSTSVILFRSLGLSLLATFIVLLLAYPYAYFVTQLKKPSHRFWALAFIAFPIYMNSIVRLIGIKTMLDFIIADNTNQLRNIVAIIYMCLPLMVIPIYNNLSTLNESVVNASKDLGNNSFRTFLKVTLPYSLPGVFSGIALVFLTSVTSVAIPAFMTPTRNWIGNIIYNLFDPSSLHTSADLSLGALITVITSLCTISIYLLIKFLPRLFFGKNNNIKMKPGRK